MSCGSAKEMNGGIPTPTTAPPPHHSPGEGVCGHLGKGWFSDSLPPGTQGAGLRDKVGTSLGGGSSG